MATLISLDLGFDRDALENPGNERLPLLQHGLTVPDKPGNPVALARRLKVHDRLLITLYDLTGSPAEIESLSLRAAFQKAREQEHDSPFEAPSDLPTTGPIEYSRHVIYRAIADSGYSTVYEGDFPIWHVYPPTAESAEYPADQLGAERAPPRMRFEVTHAGFFYCTYHLEVRWNVEHGESVHRAFRVDPEMIIDNDGELPAPKPASR